MPVPTPKSGEKEQAFIGRCMSELADTDPDRRSDQRLAMCGTSWRSAKGIKESNVKTLFEQVSNKSWAVVDKASLPASAFLWVEDPAKKSTWHLPIYEGAGAIDPATGMHKQRGPLNLNALRAASGAISGARTGKPMNIPPNVRAQLTALLKTHKAGQFAESVDTEIEESKKERDISIPITLKENTGIDKDNLVVKDVVLLARDSLNNREYSDPCMAGAVPLLEGIKSYLNHDDGKGGRKVQDLTGQYRNVRFVENEHKVRGDWHLLKTVHSDTLLDMAERMPGIAGNSIHARGRYHKQSGKDMVEEIVNAHSVDLVTEAATTKGLFEGREQTEEGEDMEWKEVTVGTLRENKNDVAEAFIAEGVNSRNDEVKGVTEERDTLKAENATLKASQATLARKELVEKKITEAKMDAKLVTEVFRSSLLGIQEKKEGDKVVATVEAQIDEQIKDRMGIPVKEGGVKNMGGEKKVAEGAEEVEVKDEDGVKKLVECVLGGGGLATTEDPFSAT